MHAERIDNLLAAWLQLVPGCVREGFNDPDKLLLFWHLRRYAGLYPRVRVHQVFDDSIRGQLPTWKALPDIDSRRSAIHGLIGNAPP